MVYIGTRGKMDTPGNMDTHTGEYGHPHWGIWTPTPGNMDTHTGEYGHPHWGIWTPMYGHPQYAYNNIVTVTDKDVCCRCGCPYSPVWVSIFPGVSILPRVPIHMCRYNTNVWIPDWYTD